MRNDHEDDPPLHSSPDAVTLPPPGNLPAEFAPTGVASAIPTPPPSSRAATDPAPPISPDQAHEIIALLHGLKEGVSRAESAAKATADGLLQLAFAVHEDISSLDAKLSEKIDEALDGIASLQSSTKDGHNAINELTRRMGGLSQGVESALTVNKRTYEQVVGIRRHLNLTDEGGSNEEDEDATALGLDR